MIFIIVLGNSKRHVWEKRVDRAIEEFDELKQNHLEQPYIIFSGGNQEAEYMASYAKEKGFDPFFSILENQSRNTVENIQFSLKIIENSNKTTYSGNTEIVVCTSSFHIRRSMILAKIYMNCYKLRAIHTNEEVNQEEREHEKNSLLHHISQLMSHEV